MIIINSLVEALLQLLVFALIPLIYFVIRNKGIKGFTKDLWFYKPPKGWVNEKKSNGSIIPSWVIHGTSNVIAPIIMLLWL